MVSGVIRESLNLFCKAFWETPVCCAVWTAKSLATPGKNLTGVQPTSRLAAYHVSIQKFIFSATSGFPFES